METLIVVHNRKNWDLQVPGVRVVEARDYLTDDQYSQLRDTRVFNLCRSYKYLSLGYYVSLLAEARGHRPLPTINTIQDVRQQPIVQEVADDLDELVQKSLAPVQSPRFALSIYFGRNLAKRYERLSLQLFNLFPAPLMRAQFVHRDTWELQSLYTISSSEVPQSHRPFVEWAAGMFFAGRVNHRRRRRAYPYDLAILTDPDDANPPSNAAALRKFARAAGSMGMKATFVTKDDYGRVGEFDALFIRDTTNVNHYTYRFASRAAAAGLVVIDDPQSIVRCTNKVFLAELLARHGLRTPHTTIVHEDSVEAVAQNTHFPCILKRPDGSFSQGVVKVDDSQAFQHEAERMLEDSDLIIAQEFMPTPWDWRVGVLDHKPLYVCRYWMAPEHWKILDWDENGNCRHGRFETMRVERAPHRLVRTAVRAASLVGDGFYGVDLKEIGDRVYVIEVNDNPNIDAGVEDLALRSELYERILSVFHDRLERRRRGRRRS